MKRKIAKIVALLVLFAAIAATTIIFGIKAWALTLLQLIAYAVWMTNDFADREELIIEETVMAIMRMMKEAPEDIQALFDKEEE